MADPKDPLKLAPLDAILIERRHESCIEAKLGSLELRADASLLGMQILERADKLAAGLLTLCI
jgi:hypothetical protein